MSANGRPLPANEGATYSVGSDRYPATIVEVTLFASGPRKGQPREVTVQTDNWTVVSGSQHDGTAKYVYNRDYGGAKRTFKAQKDGTLGAPGHRLHLGSRDRYYDPHV